MLLNLLGSHCPIGVFFRKEDYFCENFEENEINAEASFTNDLGADSLDTVELIMEFEKEFNISIPDEDAEKIHTVGDAVTYLEANTK